MLELLGLPSDASFGLPTGAGIGNAVGLAAGRHAVLARAGWDVEANGLYGAPEITVIVGEEAHATLLTALQYLGLGAIASCACPPTTKAAWTCPRRRVAIEAAGDGPLIVATQAGNVNTGAFDPIGGWPRRSATIRTPGSTSTARSGCGRRSPPSCARWWPASNAPTRGRPMPTSGSTSATTAGSSPSGMPRAHRAAMSMTASYLMRSEQRENWEWVMDSSRRARGFVLYAAIRSLGRDGVRALVERCCALARRIADRLREADGVEVLNDVVLNQVLVRFGDDLRTRAVINAVQAEGIAWMGGTTWQGRAAMRISVSNWSTTEADADRTVDSILRAPAPRAELRPPRSSPWRPRGDLGHRSPRAPTP